MRTHIAAASTRTCARAHVHAWQAHWRRQPRTPLAPSKPTSPRPGSKVQPRPPPPSAPAVHRQPLPHLVHVHRLLRRLLRLRLCCQLGRRPRAAARPAGSGGRARGRGSRLRRTAGATIPAAGLCTAGPAQLDLGRRRRLKPRPLIDGGRRGGAADAVPPLRAERAAPAAAAAAGVGGVVDRGAAEPQASRQPCSPQQAVRPASAPPALAVQTSRRCTAVVAAVLGVWYCSCALRICGPATHAHCRGPRRLRLQGSDAAAAGGLRRSQHHHQTCRPLRSHAL